MRDYSKVSSSIWTGKTGKAIRKDTNAQIVALYLMTSPHANMIGVFHCPVGYIQIDTGLSEEGASKGLQRLVEMDFCTFDSTSDTVWVHEMAKYQIGDELKETDNQIKGVKKQFENLPEGAIKQGFYFKYCTAFHLGKFEYKPSPLEAPLEPEAGAGAETEEKPSLENSLDAFNSFWKAYPKKVGKEAARKAWKKIKKPVEVLDLILKALEWQMRSEQWFKDNGAFIPHPATYLNQGRWQDEPTKVVIAAPVITPIERKPKVARTPEQKARIRGALKPFLGKAANA